MTFPRFILPKHFLILLCVIVLGICVSLIGLLEWHPSHLYMPSSGNISVLSGNVSSCDCKDQTDLYQFLPSDQLDDIIKSRAKEYREHQLRMKTNTDILIAPANSPLQYPIRGFNVAPLQKSLIPGLALYTQKREVYKVSLSVEKGVLSVDDDVNEEQVNGQGESKLTISSSSLKQVNDLLSKVTYTSTIYHIKTSDLVYFSFEDSEAVFPVIIRRPAVPVLFSPGNDINSQVTITTKTFLRYNKLKVLIKSIRKVYQKIKIIIADDNPNPENLSDDNIEQYIMPPAQGWFAGRNLAVSQVTTKYFLWVDDDFEFLDETRIESFVEIMEANPELDVVGGAVSGEQYYFSLEYIEDDEGGCLRRFQGRHHKPLPGFDGCFFVDVVVNFFLARTDAVRRVGFDPFLKRVGHTEFFIDGLGKLLVASCKDLSIGHQIHEPHEEYDVYRNEGESEIEKKYAHHFYKNYLKCIKY
nr:beta-1,4 N-acetylgalactosaminyltransferase 2-like isoform X4 [Misgurnus anguillicaudatus]XP_055050500.1 beta-1,4 N-acetylgalactosaminyltransferase 2-like isoform X4 [Misgurnus anguillicaudatus]XP_055050501.1 beta-1,4 N-acetylgalactosaminyltransferase 2-like isoform X4 [Misgurnus anguillicaudatus]